MSINVELIVFPWLASLYLFYQLGVRAELNRWEAYFRERE